MPDVLYIEYFIAVAVLIAVVIIPGAKKKYYIQAKVFASASFMLALLLAPVADTLELAAFVCCFAGDVMMAFYNRKRRKRDFLGGLFTFLAGHIFFVLWLSSMQMMAYRELVIPAITVCAVTFITADKRIHTGRLRPCIIMYSFFMSLFLSKSVHLLQTGVTAKTICIACGGMLFAASDFSILFLYFAKIKGKGIHVFNLVSYYIGMLLLAMCMYF
jgi:uncharacterized membrane protein YhhN